MSTWPIFCGNCKQGVAASVVYGWPKSPGGAAYSLIKAHEVARSSTLWLRCPDCGEGSVKLRDGAVYPVAPASRMVDGLPADVANAWREARTAHAVAAYTAAEIMCRKILMHVAVDKAKSDEGKSFVQYVNELEAEGYITKGLTDVVDQVRQRGNIANHELVASSERDSLTTMTITEHLLRGMYELPGLAPPATP